MKTTAIDISPDDVDFLTSNTRFTSEEIRNWYKAFLADCPDGKLTKKKFVEIYKLFFPTGNPQGFCEQVFRTFDEGKVAFARETRVLLNSITSAQL